MNVLKAAFNVVHDGDGGAGAVAELLGRRSATIDHEVNPTPGSTAKFGLVDAVKLTRWRRDYRILYAFAEECGHICVPAPASTSGDSTTQEILAKASKLSEEIAQSFARLNGALSDGTITGGELAEYEREAMDVIAAVADVVRATRSKMEGDLERRHAAIEAARRSTK
jgi:hypothetical protein